MTGRLLSLLAILSIPLFCADGARSDAGARLDDLLPPEAMTPHKDTVPDPEAFFGFPVGEWHLQHHQVLNWCRALADAAPGRVRLEITGRTHGNRNTLLLLITSPENQRRIDELRTANVANALGETAAGEEAPVVLWLGYSIHGNEPSGTHAAMVVAWHLAAATDPATEALLQKAVILIDPMLNPDGLDRFAAWSNNHRGRIPNPDPAHREHREDWPGARTNYYWFDLNRDWLPAVHPETRAHLETFHRWRPAVVADFHEMTSDATYFFQPGIPERVNPLIPAGNQAITRQLAGHHAAALDAAGALYFSEERFDDFYVGKGSTYPDLLGSVGILFEQASARGHTRDTDNGPLTLRDAVRNHVRTSLSTIAAAVAHRGDLLRHQFDTADSAVHGRFPDAPQACLFAAPGDPLRLRMFADVLEAHRIQYQYLRDDSMIGDTRFPAGETIHVPFAQPGRHLITAMFEKRTTFASGAFYDTSAWNIAEAYGLQWTAVDEPIPPEKLIPSHRHPPPQGRLAPTDDAVALAVSWTQHQACRAAWRFLHAGARVRAAMRPFSATTTAGEVSFPAGTLLLPFGNQNQTRAEVVDLARRVAAEEALTIHAITTALTPAGPDLGSSSFHPLAKPTVLLVAGPGANAYRTGEVWHLLDREHGIPVTLVAPSDLTRQTLRSHNVIIYAGGRIADIEDRLESLRDRVGEGGVLIFIGETIRDAVNSGLVPAKLRQATFPRKDPVFAEIREEAAQRRIRGAILQALADTTHPIAFGIGGKRIALMRACEVFLDTDVSLASPVRYSESPVVSGYVSEPNQQALRGTAAVQIHELGEGRIILLPDAPAFRGYWHGSERLLINAIFFGPLMRPPAARGDDA